MVLYLFCEKLHQVVILNKLQTIAKVSRGHKEEERRVQLFTETSYVPKRLIVTSDNDYISSNEAQGQRPQIITISLVRFSEAAAVLDERRQLTDLLPGLVR